MKHVEKRTRPPPAEIQWARVCFMCFLQTLLAQFFSGAPVILEVSVCYITTPMQSKPTEDPLTGAVLLYMLMWSEYQRILGMHSYSK